MASGLTSTQENRTLNWIDARHSDRIFGNVIGKSRLFALQNLQMQGSGGQDDVKFLKAEVLRDLESPSSFLEEDGGYVQSWAVNQDEGYGWTAEQIWGFEVLEGKRYYTRRVVVRKGQEVQRVRLVYDYNGSVDAAAVDREIDPDMAYGD